MGKQKKSGSSGPQQRIRINPLTGEREVVPGTRSGKKRTRLPPGHPLRTHDLREVEKKKAKQKKFYVDEDDE